MAHRFNRRCWRRLFDDDDVVIVRPLGSPSGFYSPLSHNLFGRITRITRVSRCLWLTRGSPPLPSRRALCIAGHLSGDATWAPHSTSQISCTSASTSFSLTRPAPARFDIPTSPRCHPSFFALAANAASMECVRLLDLRCTYRLSAFPPRIFTHTPRGCRVLSAPSVARNMYACPPLLNMYTRRQPAPPPPTHLSRCVAAAPPRPCRFQRLYLYLCLRLLRCSRLCLRSRKHPRIRPPPPTPKKSPSSSAPTLSQPHLPPRRRPTPAACVSPSFAGLVRVHDLPVARVRTRRAGPLPQGGAGPFSFSTFGRAGATAVGVDGGRGVRTCCPRHGSTRSMYRTEDGARWAAVLAADTCRSAPPREDRPRSPVPFSDYRPDATVNIDLEARSWSMEVNRTLNRPRTVAAWAVASALLCDAYFG
ncbi:hypothetical protein B0H11DRAFT_2263209 [Mycena galericulata]|nr:hypothetical protein B0H11DRAFT_2263209 [Mycena galericulata]